MKKVFLSLSFILITTIATAQTDSTAFMKTLCNLTGVSNVQRLKSEAYKEKYVLKFKQNIDGGNDAKGTFDQRIVVGYKGANRPTVLVTEGYYADYALNPRYEEELADLFEANLIFCEYRFFGESTPIPTNWSYMTVDNSLRDYHHVRQEFGKIFKNKWISTGISKGGQTTMFYRATYPNDVDVSVSYVAPLNKSVEDGRHEKFLSSKVGTKEERRIIQKAQQEFMKRKSSLLPLFSEYNRKNNLKFYIPEEDVFDYVVLEYPFALWQWGEYIIDREWIDISDKDVFDHLMKISSPDYFAFPNRYMPFDVQAAHELGYYGYDLKPIKKWASVRNTKGYLKQIMLPDSLRNIEFDPTLYKRTVNYLKTHDPKHIFIYGEIDPWSASGVCSWLDCSKKRNMKIYVQPRGSHKARIKNMPDEIKGEIMERLNKWME